MGTMIGQPGPQPRKIPEQTQENVMPKYPSSKGDYSKVEVTGYVHYNAGGFIGIGSEPKFDFEGKFDTDKGEYYFDIPESMIASVEPAEEYEYETLFRGLIYDNPVSVVVQFVGSSDPRSTSPWVLVNTNKRVPFDPHADDSEILWSPEGI